MSVLFDDNQRDVVRTQSGNYVLVDTGWQRADEWETKVFPCDKSGNTEGFMELDVAFYTSREQAALGHAEMTDKWRKK